MTRKIRWRRSSPCCGRPRAPPALPPRPRMRGCGGASRPEARARPRGALCLGRRGLHRRHHSLRGFFLPRRRPVPCGLSRAGARRRQARGSGASSAPRPPIPPPSPSASRCPLFAGTATPLPRGWPAAGFFVAWRHSRSGKCSAGGETTPLKAFFLAWLPPRRRGGCFRAAPGPWPDRFWGRVAARMRLPRIEETLD